MDKLPIISGRELIKILLKAGFYPHHQTGSHVILKRDIPPCRITVPDHKTIKRGLLRSIINEAGLTREEFLKLAEEF